MASKMLKQGISAAAFAAAIAVTGNSGAQTTGTFQMPFNPDEIWTQAECQSDPAKRSGFRRTQYVFELNKDLVNKAGQSTPKYHLGEDWVGNCGGSTYLDAPIVSIADGFVVHLESVGSNTDGVGKYVHVQHTLPDGTPLDIFYLHLDSIDTALIAGGPVFQGQGIGKLGDGNGQYTPHLHFESRWTSPATCPVISTPFAAEYHCDPYVNPLTVTYALNYTAPSLLVSDRLNPMPITLKFNDWTYFSVPSYTPSSTAYIQPTNSNRQRYSLSRSVEQDIIDPSIYYYDGKNWIPYSNVISVFFAPNVWHALYSRVPVATLTIFPPRYGQDPGRDVRDRNDRARLDLIRAMSDAGIFTCATCKILMENYFDEATTQTGVPIGNFGGYSRHHHSVLLGYITSHTKKRTRTTRHITWHAIQVTPIRKQMHS
jgi:murein DD-endopeptidase MepM/ murein hydrolase activator NlpD